MQDLSSIKLTESQDKAFVTVSNPGASELQINQYKSLGGTYSNRLWTFPANVRKALEAAHGKGNSVAAKAVKAEQAEEAKAVKQSL